MRARTILDTLREPMFVLNGALRVNVANRSFYRTFQVSPRGQETNSFAIWGMASGTFPSCAFSLKLFVSATGQPLCKLLRDEAG
jgi:hypothetical protein